MEMLMLILHMAAQLFSMKKQRSVCVSEGKNMRNHRKVDQRDFFINLIRSSESD
ncbi:hypothetical protein INR49_027744, partial [Caranx melampygus]